MYNVCVHFLQASMRLNSISSYYFFTSGGGDDNSGQMLHMHTRTVHCALRIIINTEYIVQVHDIFVTMKMASAFLLNVILK